VGTYAIVATLSDNGTGALANYTVTVNNGTLTVNPAPLTVVANNATMIYGDPLPSFTGTVTGIKNGENITASYSTTATSASSVGTYSIVPSVSDNGTGVLSNYAVTLTNGTLTINPAPLTVTAANATMIYGDPLPSFTGTISGIKNSDNITASYSTTATSASPVGTYSIVPAASDNNTGKLTNYTVTLVNGTLTINQAPLTVTAANASMTFGDAVPALTGTITGIKNGDAITASYSTTASSSSPVGNYPIVPTASDGGTGKLANYAITVVNGTLTISPAPLTVTAASATMIYGDPIPALSGTITGIKNGNNITASYSTVATSASPVGAYPIVPTVSDNGTGALANYTVTLVNSTLTIGQAPLTVTGANATRVYGDPNPAFSGTVTGIKNGDNITATFASATDPTTTVGNYPIVGTASDNGTGTLANYKVTLVNGTLSITPAPLSATANNATRVYGDPNPAFTGTITGLKNGDNITFGATSADPTVAVGTYPIVPALVDPTGKLVNYTVTATNGTLTVTPAPLTVTAANASMLFGDPVPTLTGSVSGIKNGDNITGIYTTTASSTSPVGAYPITASASDNGTGKLSNYTVSLGNGTLTVNPAPLTVTASNSSMIYGDPVPAVTGTLTGVKNGNNITAGFSVAVTSASPVGTYAILAAVSDNGTGALANYSVTINNGVLLVAPAPLSVTAANGSRLYGDPNPVFTGTIVGIKNNDNITAAFSSATDPTTTVGNYPIVPSASDNGTGALANYTVTLNNGTLTINQAPLTIQANDATGTAGQPIPALSGTITGIKNNDTITASYSTTADQTSPAGTYPITPSADPNPLLVNYSITLINGTLTLQ
ncbi:MAG TPA: MBG domain-containing protein, partial [Candidatus Limnocylindrales bacterium]|nr:MBG domain-containing protein [Candidatus Limnocylindrales bacterium]